MPVIVVGADTPNGREIVDSLLDPQREVRAFVSDPDVGAAMKRKGAKVAIGDVSDESHVQAASTQCFTAVLITEAARDGRERSFARDEAQVLKAWAAAVADVKRVIWVHDGEVPPTRPKEMVVVNPDKEDLVALVVELDDAASL